MSSLKVIRLFSHFSRVKRSHTDLNAIKKCCLHCSSYHLQKDDSSGELASTPATPRFIEKEEMISKAMKSYLLQKKSADEFLEKNISEYSLGRRHLANIMGLNEEDMTKEQIQKAIDYLLPSGLHNRRARPLMEHPLDLLPDVRGANFDSSGRPDHFLFYTTKPKYFQVMHDLVAVLESLKQDYSEEDMANLHDYYQQKKLNVFGTEWLSLNKFQKQFEGEKINEHDYNRFLLLMERILEQPMSYREKDLIMSYRINITNISLMTEYPKPSVDDEGREFVVAQGSRKKASATVTLRSKGSGSITINGEDITYFKDLLHRETVLWPLQLCDLLGKMDVEVVVEGDGVSAQAGAIRLGMARAVASFVPQETREILRIAGLLTRDPRMKERKKPGQEKARKKFTWKKR